MVPRLYAHDPFLALHRAMQRPWLDVPAAAVSRLCEGWALALLALVVILWLERLDLRRVAVAFLPLGLALAASGAAVQELKELFATPRPLAVFGPAQVRVALEPLFLYGFPSGHSSAVATFAVYLALAYRRRVAWVWALMLAGGLSRVYVGAHWALDVVGGWALGALLGIVAHALTARAVPTGRLTRGAGAHGPGPTAP